MRRIRARFPKSPERERLALGPMPPAPRTVTWRKIAFRGLGMSFAVNAALCTVVSAEPNATMAASAVVGESPALGTIVPVGTHVRFHLDVPLSSSKSNSGQRFTFTMLDAISVGSQKVVNAGARGEGTVLLAGHAGTGGHEGDLTLRVDHVETPNKNELGFDDARFEINGTNRKIASAALGFVPYVGLGAHFIRGHESRVGTDVPELVITTRPATVMSEADAAFLTPAVPHMPTPAPKMSASPSPTPSR